MSTQPKAYITPQQYLEIERRAEYKSEYCAGEMFATAGATERHVILVGNALFALRQQLAGEDRRVYSNDMRVRVNATGLYTYPDLIVVCGPRQFADDQSDTLLNPQLIVEVLSPSTEAYDRGRKFDHYKTIPSLIYYVLIANDRIHVDLLTRESENRWIVTSASGPDATLDLPALAASFSLAALYEQTDLTPGF
ncbi:MAG TPA: Uma2 family endonuclease [Bryobacteraceae bacterium]|nr:Uma2 family endonuclease [Bryobacteraceae bacterium]